MNSRRILNAKQVSWRSLVRKSEFQKVYARGAKRVGRLVVVYFLLPEEAEIAAAKPDFAWAVVASRKIGNAVARNRAKRLLREARRLGILGSLSDPGNFDLLRQTCGRFPREPGGEIVSGGDTGERVVADEALTAEKTNTFAGLWVVLVARRNILRASSREVREELDSLLTEHAD